MHDYIDGRIYIGIPSASAGPHIKKVFADLDSEMCVSYVSNNSIGANSLTNTAMDP